MMNEIEKLYFAEYYDIDWSIYKKIKSDVKMFRKDVEKIDKILKYYSSLVDNKSYFIMGNYICFTYNDIKYYDILSNYEDEINYIDKVKEELQKIGCKNIYYKKGYID